MFPAARQPRSLETKHAVKLWSYISLFSRSNTYCFNFTIDVVVISRCVTESLRYVTVIHDSSGLLAHSVTACYVLVIYMIYFIKSFTCNKKGVTLINTYFIFIIYFCFKNLLSLELERIMSLL